MPSKMRSRLWPALVLALASCLAAWTSFAGAKQSDQAWVATWGASPVAPLPANTTNPGFTNQTVRLIVHTSLGGNEVRVRLSNAFGTESLVIGAAHLALHGMNAATISGTDRPLTFSGSSSVTIPPGALVVSDGVKLDVPALSDLAVSLYLPGPTGQATWHAAALSTNYISKPGDFTGAADLPVDHTDVLVLFDRRRGEVLKRHFGRRYFRRLHHRWNALDPGHKSPLAESACRAIGS